MDNTRVIFAAGAGKQWMVFRTPRRILTTGRPEEVLPLLHEAQKAVDGGLCVAGFLCYEAAVGLDAAMQTHAPGGLPLVWLGVFPQFELLAESAMPPAAGLSPPDWQESMPADRYGESVGRIKDYLKSGDTYQVNFTMRQRGRFDGDAWSLFCRMQRNQRAKYAAFVDTDRFAICSASPELFFALDGNTLVSRPMKGTSKRGLTCDQDRELADALHNSPKNRAENVMIVDMVRNDMGRIAASGSVLVSSLYDVERYPTMLQMTSSVECRTSADLPGIMKALFPCASITGAPKIRAMQIIRELEDSPRGIYTGCIGYFLPHRKAQFNVAIRTVCIDKQGGTTEYGVGGGIVWDSDTAGEYEECRTKAAVLTADAPSFELLETMLWDGGNGWFLLDRHMERLKRSAEYFGFAAKMENIIRSLHEKEPEMGNHPCRVRLRVGEEGGIAIDICEAPARVDEWTVALASGPVDQDDPFLYHKTTNRTIYELARRSAPGCDEVLLWNTRGEITEGTIANVVIDKAGRLVTPPVKCGLLPGVFRGELLERGEICEEIVTVEDVRRTGKLFLVNSLRKWMPARLGQSH